MAIVAGIVAGGTAVAVGASALVAVGVGLVAASAYDYAIDSLMEDAAVDTMSGRDEKWALNLAFCHHNCMAKSFLFVLCMEEYFRPIKWIEVIFSL